MFSYPIIVFPDELTKNINSESYYSECKDQPPKEPYKPEKQKIFGGCLTGLAFYIVLALVASAMIPLSYSLPIGIIATILLGGVYSIIEEVEFNKKMKKYSEAHNWKKRPT